MNILEIIDLYRSNNKATEISLQFIVWAMIFGFIISFFVIYYRRTIIGSFVRAIRAAEAIDPASAKTLAELGQEENISAISAIQKSESLRRMIIVINEEEPDFQDSNKKKQLVKIDENTRFYISEESATRSRIQYGEEPDSVIPLVIGSIAFIAIGIVVFMLSK